jgi:hypothetical protein
MGSITKEQATQRTKELRDYLIGNPEDTHAAMLLQLWERMVGDLAPVVASAMPKVLPPTQAEIEEARKNVPAYGRFEAGPPAVTGGLYGQMRVERQPHAPAGIPPPPHRPAPARLERRAAVHLPLPNAFDRPDKPLLYRTDPGETVKVTLEPSAGTVTPVGGAIAPVFSGDIVAGHDGREVKFAPLGKVPGPDEVPGIFFHTADRSPAHATALGELYSSPEPPKPWRRVPADASIGIVIGTHGSVAYVHLGLELLRIHNPDVRVLVHDDSSDEQEWLAQLCSFYRADFVSTKGRRRETVGDASAFAEGLKWGEREGLDIVVKVSRRFLFDRPFAASLREVMHNLEYATATAPCAHFSFGFRSECVAMAVEPWVRSGALAEFEEFVRQNQPHGLPEAWHHELARKVHKFAHPLASGADDDHHPACDYVVRSEQRYGRRNGNGDESWDAYAWWPLMGLSRPSVVPGVYWHNSHEPADYATLADHYHLPYDAAAFTVTPGE